MPDLRLSGLAPRQPRRRRGESRLLHAGIVLLRREGFTVYRAGRGEAFINGVRYPNGVIEEFARGERTLFGRFAGRR
jgi:hypothetical protein